MNKSSKISTDQIESIKKELTQINKKLDFILNHISGKNIQSTGKETVKKSGNITIHKYSKKIHVLGQTFDIKDTLKTNGAVWDKPSKSWQIKYSDNNWFKNFTSNLEKICDNVTVINKKDDTDDEDKHSNSSNNSADQVFEFLDEDC